MFVKVSSDESNGASNYTLKTPGTILMGLGFKLQVFTLNTEMKYSPTIIQQ